MTARAHGIPFRDELVVETAVLFALVTPGLDWRERGVALRPADRPLWIEPGVLWAVEVVDPVVGEGRVVGRIVDGGAIARITSAALQRWLTPILERVAASADPVRKGRRPATLPGYAGAAVAHAAAARANPNGPGWRAAAAAARRANPAETCAAQADDLLRALGLDALAVPASAASLPSVAA